MRSERSRRIWNVGGALALLATTGYFLQSPEHRASIRSTLVNGLASVGPAELSRGRYVPPASKIQAVEWDGYSLFIHGQRIFLWSGEFHTWRLPVPELWRDVLQKIKASGMNAISVYVHWGLTNPAPGVFDFDGYRALEPLFEMAMETGLWVVLRPGPYINAETTAGGIPHWVTSAVTSHLRDNSTSYKSTWAPYIRKITEIIKPYQITKGGPIIAVQMENEFVDRDDVGYPGKKEMMQQLKAELLEGGIDVPLTINDAYMGGNYVYGEGAGDIYGFDSYPQSFDCANPETWKPVVTNYWDFHQRTNPDQPLYIPEFQGGAYDPWGPNAPSYAACAKLTGASFESVFNLNLWANNAKMINLYMMYGGTSWGYLQFPGVYTSYDYGAAISENRDIANPKYAELKREGLFLRSVPDFYKTDVIGNSTSGAVHLDNLKVFATLLKNPDTGAAFYIVRHTDSTFGGNATFQLSLTAPDGNSLKIPQFGSAIQLIGRESRVIVTDLSFTSPSQTPPSSWSPAQLLLSSKSKASPLTLLYSTASIFVAGNMGGRQVLFLHGDSYQEHEIALRMTEPKSGFQARTKDGHVVLRDGVIPGSTVVNILPGLNALVVLYESKDHVVLYADSKTADTFFAPVLSNDDKEFGSFWSIGTNDTVLVGGPALVRSASYSKEDERLDLYGDLDVEKETWLTVLGTPAEIKSIRWNGQEIEPMQSVATSAFIKRYALPNPSLSTFAPVTLGDWEFMDSLPEIQTDFDDSDWVTADHVSTNLPYKPVAGEKVLYGCDYGFCEGVVLWRGHFTATGKETAVRLVINGGEAFAASVYINDVLIRTTYGNSTNNQNIVRETDEIYVFPEDAIVKGGDNVLTVVQDNMGLDETWNHWDTDGSRSPRGIRGYELHGGSFDYWKVQGKVGGFENYRDKLRGIFNEGGLYGERKQLHLPQDNKSTLWSERSPTSGLPSTARYARLVSQETEDEEKWVIAEGGHSGVGFFRTTLELNERPGYDTMMSFVFEDKGRKDPPYRALLFVNGWMMGKRVGNLGPQTKFPVHEGILNYRGTNTIVLALWSMDPALDVGPELRLVVDKVYQGGVRSEADAVQA